MNTNARPVYVVVKALCLFVVLDVVYGLVMPPVADVSVYNFVVPGLARMPFGVGNDSYTVTMDDVDTMFASHEISAERMPDEIRVALIGDSTVRGDSLPSADTLAGQLNRLSLQCGDKKVKAYNLGYPHPSIIKDLIFFEETIQRQPDAIIWFITLNTLMNQYRLNPFLTANRVRAVQMMDTYDIPIGFRKSLSEQETGFYEKTLVGQRSYLARWLKLQALGLVWSATGDDIHSSVNYVESVPRDVKKASDYRGLGPGTDLRGSLLLGAFAAGYDLAGETLVLLVNEPIFVADGMNSESRYNNLYPRWAYQQYRELLSDEVNNLPWSYLDSWDVIPPEYFTDSPLHLSAEGERLFAEQISPALLSMVCP